ncbi:MAG: hypothetical protein MUO63_22510, partial [Desulfobulbaceae bacterium]|nr:hypothetical protein [Desulfobulbaceae bacterium]
MSRPSFFSTLPWDCQEQAIPLHLHIFYMRGITVNPDFMHEAIRLSRGKSFQGEGGPFGAVIVRDGKIIARGWNQVLKNNDPTCH